MKGRLCIVLLALSLLAFAGTAQATGTALDSEEQVFLTLLNNYRTANGVQALASNDQLNAAAQWMANDTATERGDRVFTLNKRDHIDSLGRDPFQRMDAFGYTWFPWRGENLAASTATAQGAFDVWKASPGHNANMLNTHFKEIGIARVYRDGTLYGWYWATEFGPGTPPAPPPVPAPPAVQAPSPAAALPDTGGVPPGRVDRRVLAWYHCGVPLDC